MGWIYLGLAIVFEVAGTLCMKLSKGLSDWRFAPWIFFFYGVSFVFLTYAVRLVELSTAYAIWSGVGVTAIALIGILWFDESAGLSKLAFLLLVVVGIVGLKLSGGELEVR